MTEYNGHRSWNAWNVALWIGNDEFLYRSAVNAMQRSYTFEQATDAFFYLTKVAGVKTPDGAVYNRLSVNDALRGLDIKLKEH